MRPHPLPVLCLLLAATLCQAGCGSTGFAGCDPACNLNEECRDGRCVVVRPACTDDRECPVGSTCLSDGYCSLPDPADGDGGGEGDGDEVADGDAGPDGDADPADEEPDLPAERPVITVHPTELDFGAVSLYERREGRFALSNVGLSPLTVGRFEIVPTSDEFDIAAGELPLVVQPGGSTQVQVLFTERDNRETAVDLFIESDDPARPRERVGLSASIKARPFLEVEPREVVFDGVPLGRRAVRGVTLRNLGSQDLYVTGIGLQQGPEGSFSTEGLPAGLSAVNPWTIPIGGQAGFEVAVVPPGAGSWDATLLIDSNDEERARIGVPVRAQATVPDIEVTPLALDFSGSDYPYDVRYATIANVGDAPLSVESVEFGPGTDPVRFRFELNPPRNFDLEPGRSYLVGVEYHVTADPVDGSLLVRSNDPDEPEVAVLFSGFSLPPTLRVEPDPVDFEEIPAGQTTSRTVTLTNAGGGSLHIESVTLESLGLGQFAISGAWQPDLEAGRSTSITAHFRPDAAGQYTDRLTIVTNDPDPVRSAYPLTLNGTAGESIHPPLAVARVRGHTGTEVELPPITAAVLDGSQSSDLDRTGAPAAIAAWRWDIRSRPAGSMSVLSSSRVADPSVRFDLPGEYVVALAVQDGDGQWSAETADSVLTVRVVPHEQIHIQLIWQKNMVVDLDLHLYRDATGYADPAHCYYANPAPDWGTDGHPTLDHDNRGSADPDNEPENINLDDPGDSLYRVHVHYYDAYGAGDTEATLRVYLGRSLVPAFERRITLRESTASHDWTDPRSFVIPCKIRWHKAEAYGEVIPGP